MLVAFRKQNASPRDPVSRLIAWWTQSEVVHCELILENEGLSGSARPSEDGVSLRPVSEIYKKASDWDAYRVPMACSEEEVAYFMMHQGRCQYNYRGIIATQLAGMTVPVDGFWFCSELIFAVLQRYSALSLPNIAPAQVSPAELRRMLLQQGCTRQQLPI